MSFSSVLFLAYVVTIVSETIAILILQKPKDVWQWMAGVILINSFTQPIAIYFIQIECNSFFLVEAGVFIVEASWYKIAFAQKWGRALVLSFVANIASIATGILVRHILGI